MRITPATRGALLSVLFGLTGCLSKRFELPMTAAQMAGYNDPAALSAYLSQPDASADVCDLRSTVPHLKVVDDDTRKALDRGFRSGQVSPGLWSLCMKDLIRDSDPPLSQALMDDVAHEALNIVNEKQLETDANQQARLQSVWDVYIKREFGRFPSPKALNKLESGLQSDLEKDRLSHFGQMHAQDLLQIINLEQGLWQGKPVDSTLLKGFMAKGDEKSLRRSMLHLPDASLRAEARQLVIQLHIKASPFPEVRQMASEVEKTMLALGMNPVSLAVHPPVRGSLDPNKVPQRKVIVEQNLTQQTARLLGYAVNAATPTVLPAIPLREVLQVELKGISKAVTVCGSEKELDVSPCLNVSDVRPDSSFGVINHTGVLHVNDAISESAAVALARTGHPLELPILVANKPVAAVSWPLAFQTPRDWVFVGQGGGHPGPDLDVRVDASDPTKLLYAVSSAGGQPQWAVVEPSAAGKFHIISRGAEGYSGSDGSDGSSGMDGMSGSDGSCPSFSGTDGSSGTNGSDGGDGGSGGPGGKGGNITVTLAGSQKARLRLLPILRQGVLSQGGPGGSGGSGGRGGAGGHGGRGGSGSTCTETDADGNVTTTSVGGGMSGSDGLSGRDGFGGSAGVPGKPGQVVFVDDN